MGLGVNAHGLEFSFGDDRNFLKVNCMMVAQPFKYTNNQ